MIFQKHILLLSFTFLLINNSWAEKATENNSSASKDSLNLNFLSPTQISLSDSVVNYGKLFLNTPYHYGSSGSNSFDCSGFTSYVYNNFGYNLQRNSAEQAQQFDTIDRCQLKTGDLVFFSGRGRSKKVGHVGIVVAAKENGEFDFIHSAVHKGVTISNSTEPYYTKHFIKANRVIGYNPLLAVIQPVAKSAETMAETPTLIPFSGNVQKTEKIIPAEYHRVKKGETLSSIALKYGITVAELKESNDIKGNKINRNQKLLVKDEESIMVVEPTKNIANNTSVKTEKTPKVEATMPDIVSALPLSHIVKKGESLYSISKLVNLSIEDLKKINNLKSGNVNAGQVILVSLPTEPTKDAKNQTAENNFKAITHKAEKGESLFTISKKFNISVADLKKLNDFNDNKIQAGQEIKVGETKEIAQATVKNSKVKQTIETVHKVIKGESLYSIAEANNMSIEELKQINHLTANQIKYGQTIKLIADVDRIDRNVSLEKKVEDAGVAHNGEVKDIAKASVKSSKNKQTKETAHKVIKGESLYSIAEANNMSIEELKQINHLSANQIKYGQTIKLIAEDEQVNTNAISQTKTEDTGIVHKVVSGESYFSIAKTYSCTIDNLKEWNKKSSNKIKVGDKLIIHTNNI
ncbi:MAG: LysM peptidoglycan-binding domain-containing protein [Paludibacter sp.]